MDGWMNGYVDEWMAGWMDGWEDGWMDEWIDLLKLWSGVKTWTLKGLRMRKIITYINL